MAFLSPADLECQVSPYFGKNYSGIIKSKETSLVITTSRSLLKLLFALSLQVRATPNQPKNNTRVQNPVPSFTDAQHIIHMWFHTYTQLLLKVTSIPRAHEMKNIFLAISKDTPLQMKITATPDFCLSSQKNELIQLRSQNKS